MSFADFHEGLRAQLRSSVCACTCLCVCSAALTRGQMCARTGQRAELQSGMFCLYELITVCFFGIFTHGIISEEEIVVKILFLPSVVLRYVYRK